MNETIIGLIAEMVGAAAVPLGIGWAVAFSQQRKEHAERLPKGPLIWGAAIAVGFAGNSMLRQLSENARHAVKVVRLQELAPGVTDSDITTAYLNTVAARAVSTMSSYSCSKRR